tara:strand:+ start:162 stop:1430 length:1269 start_codon:yes stop_codon:yes gene_type:complete
MAKYTSDANLIQGAATAYKNYDNAPGMYAGLDKAIKAGADMSKQAMADRKIADNKALKDKEKADKLAEIDREKSNKLKDNFYKMSVPIHEAAGSFDGATGRYAEVAADLEELQPRYIDVMQNGTSTEKASAQAEYNKIKASVELEVQYRSEITDPKVGMSVEAMSKGDGRDLIFVTEFLKPGRKSDEKRNKKGERTFTIDVNGTPMTRTFAEIDAMTIMTDQTVFNDVIGAKEKLGNSLRGKELDGTTRESFETTMYNNFRDKTENEMLAFVNDKGFGNKSFLDISNEPANKKSMIKEIMSNPELADFNKNGGGISPAEWESFTDAIVNPYSDVWKKKDGTHDKKAWLETSKKIMTEQMANMAENLHRSINKPKISQTNNSLSTTENFKDELEEERDINFYMNQLGYDYDEDGKPDVAPIKK